MRIRPILSAWIPTFAAAACALVLGCTGETVTAPSAPLLSIVPGGGQGQTGVVGTTLPLPLIVQVTGISGSPNGQILNFVVTSGGGSVFANVVLTGVPNSGPANKMSGIGQNSWTLGPLAGPQTVEARLIDPKSGATLTEAVFTATAVAGNASVLKPGSGNNQAAVAGSAVGIAPSVQVTDQTGNPLAGVSITFAVAGGGGSITGPAIVQTDAGGTAAVGSWILGAVAGANTLTATAGSLSGSPVTFSATGLAGPPSQIVRLAGDGQRTEGGLPVAQTPTIAVRDVHGNGVAGVAVTFTVTAGGGSMDGIGSVTTLTGVGGTASVDWTLGMAPGPNTLRATALGLFGSPAVFSATTILSLHTANQDANSITVYDGELASGNVAPIRTIAGPGTGLSTPANLVRDPAGQLYVSNYTGQSITVYALGASGNAAPVRTISGPATGFTAPYALAFDTQGQLHVFDYPSKKILVFAPGANGNATPVRVIVGPNTGLNSAINFLFAPSGELIVTDQDAQNIKVFAAGANGNVAPIRIIGGPSTGLSGPSGTQLDASGQLIVANFHGHKVTVFGPGADGDVPPIRTITGAATQLSFPTGLLLDGAGQIYVANYIGTSITIFAPGAAGNAAPVRRIAGAATGLVRPGWMIF